MPKFSLREMRPTDMVKFSKYGMPRYYGVMLQEDGEDIGAGAIVWGDKDRPFLCLEITDRLRARPSFMHRVAKKLVYAGVQACGELFVIEEKDEPTSPKWLDRLGFKPTGELMNGERLLQWHPS